MSWALHGIWIAAWLCLASGIPTVTRTQLQDVLKSLPNLKHVDPDTCSCRGPGENCPAFQDLPGNVQEKLDAVCPAKQHLCCEFSRDAMVKKTDYELEAENKDVRTEKQEKEDEDSVLFGQEKNRRPVNQNRMTSNQLESQHSLDSPTVQETKENEQRNSYDDLRKENHTSNTSMSHAMNSTLFPFKESNISKRSNGFSNVTKNITDILNNANGTLSTNHSEHHFVSNLSKNSDQEITYMEPRVISVAGGNFANVTDEIESSDPFTNGITSIGVIDDVTSGSRYEPIDLFSRVNIPSTPSASARESFKKGLPFTFFYWSYVTAFLYAACYLIGYIIPPFSLFGLVAKVLIINFFPAIIQIEIFYIVDIVLTNIYSHLI